jgi:transcriptional regulator with XRE-family HTH domain
MAKGFRERPKRLAAKLRAIRVSLGLSQSEMVKALRLGDAERSVISGFELGTKEPTLLTLLRYARLVGISTDELIDDKAKLQL